MMKLKYLLLLLPLFLFSCKKEQLLNQEQDKKVVNLTIKGAIISDDTLQFVLNGKVFGQGAGPFATPPENLLNAGNQVQIRKKSDAKVISTIDIAPKPFNQVKNIFYDGQILSDNIILTPVKNPENFGFRVRFSTTFKDFYGGAVDIEIYERYLDLETFETTFTPVLNIKNITGKFSDEFIELKPIFEVTDTYLKGYFFKIYKAGTKELPYTSTANLQISDPENNYGDFLNITKGESALLSISPYISKDGDVEYIIDNYLTTDYSSNFK